MSELIVREENIGHLPGTVSPADAYRVEHGFRLPEDGPEYRRNSRSQMLEQRQGQRMEQGPLATIPEVRRIGQAVATADLYSAWIARVVGDTSEGHD